MLLSYTYLTLAIDIMHCLWKQNMIIREFISYSIQSLLAYRYIETTVGSLIFVCLTTDYVCTTLAISFLLVSYGKVHILIWVFMGLVILNALVISGYLFRILNDTTIIYEETVRNRKILTKLQFAKDKKKESKIYKLQMMALTMIQIPFGIFFYLQRDFGLAYFSNLTDHVVQGVLTFDLR